MVNASSDVPDATKEFPMHLSASAITALLLAAGVGSLTEAAPASKFGRIASTVTPISASQSLQGKAGDGSVRQAMAA